MSILTTCVFRSNTSVPELKNNVPDNHVNYLVSNSPYNEYQSKGINSEAPTRTRRPRSI